MSYCLEDYLSLKLKFSLTDLLVSSLPTDELTDDEFDSDCNSSKTTSNNGISHCEEMDLPRRSFQTTCRIWVETMLLTKSLSEQTRVARKNVTFQSRSIAGIRNLAYK